MRAGVFFGFATIVLAASSAAPAAGQNAMGQILTPFSANTPSPTSIGQGSGGQGLGGGWQHGGHDGQFHRHAFPIFVYPFSTGFVDDGGTGSVQFHPVNTAPFAPPAPPTANDRAPTLPYKPPSVEIAPGGIEIVRGPG